MSSITKQQRDFLLNHVPAEIMRDLAKTKPQHSVKKLYENKETLVEEVSRLCDSKTIQALCDEFPVTDNLAVWFFTPRKGFDKKHLTSKVKTQISAALRDGITPSDVGDQPELYRVEEKTDLFIFRYVAKDQAQNLALSFGAKTRIAILNYYSALVHFSEPYVLLFGPYATGKAEAVVNEMNSKLDLNEEWSLTRPERGMSRDLYNKIKKRLHANLVETKRHDPKGNYQTVALQSKHRQPDLEKVSDFQGKYLHADSYYDILEYTCTNALGLSESVHVKFGHPFGRFTFRTGTTLSAIIYFESNLKVIMQ